MAYGSSLPHSNPCNLCFDLFFPLLLGRLSNLQKGGVNEKMKFNIIVVLSWAFFFMGLLAILHGLKIEDTFIFAQGTLLFVGSLFFELILMKDNLNQLKNEHKKSPRTKRR